MESKGKNAILIWLIVFVILTVALGSFIVYDKFWNKNNISLTDDKENKDVEDKETDYNSNNCDSEYQYSLSNREYIQILGHGYLHFILSKEGDVYLTSKIDNESYVEEEYEKENILKLQSKYQTYNIKDYSNWNIDNSDNLLGYKIDIDNILSMYNLFIGNNGMNIFIFLKNDGSLFYLNYEDIINGKEILTPKKIEGLENIIAIVENEPPSGEMPYAINKDGKEIPIVIE